MRDWMHDDDAALAVKTGLSVRRWRKTRDELIGHGLLRPEVHAVEGPILRFTHPEHIVAVGQMLGRL